jgi:hypothetical protein
MEEMNSKLVFSPQISRRLLKMGNQIIDIKADKNDQKRTVFVFKKDEKFNDDFNTVLNDIADEKQKRKSKTKKEEA